MQLKAKTDFSWAHRGVEVEKFKKGQLIKTDDKDLIEVSVSKGWAEKTKEPTKAEQKKALQDQLAALEAKLIDAEGDEESAIDAAIAAAKAELADL